LALRALQALTDTALSHLSLEALLPELLERVRAVMGVDNVAILLLDEAAQELEVSAARGPEEEVVGRVRIPVGVGFAGRIAATRAPLAVADLSGYPVSNPLLRDRLRSVLGVPLVAGERVLGVVHVGTTTPREFTADEAALLEQAADRIALAIERVRLFEAAEAARRAAERQAAIFQTTLEALGDGLVITDAKGRILYGNSALSRLLGAGPRDGQDGEGGEPPERVAERARALEVWDARGEPLAAEERALARVLGGETLAGPTTLEVQLRRLDGRTAFVSVSGAPVRDGEGNLIGAVMASRDVTERRQLERRTHDALDAFIAITRALVEAPDEEERGAAGGDGPDAAAGEAGGRAEPRGENPLARRLAELTRGVLGCARVSISAVEGPDMVARPVTVVGLSDDQERRWWAERETQPPRPVGEGLLPEDRERFLANATITLDLTRPPYAVPNDYGATAVLVAPMWTQGRLVGILALDYLEPGGQPHAFTPEEEQVATAVARLGAVVLDRDRLLRERAAARAEALALAEAQRRMDEFIGIAGHELRTPVTGILANLQIAERRTRQALTAGGPGAAEETLERLRPLLLLLERARLAADRQGRLVADLLDVSRISSGQLEYRLAPTDLAALVREAVEERRLNAPGRPIKVEMPEGPVMANADADRIGQVLANYLTNAVKYSEEDRPISVALRTRGAEARVEVRDQGPGLTPEQRRHLFKRFSRAPGVTVLSGSGVGLGLGLHISKTIVEQHGGQVGVESAPGAGSTFWFTLPIEGGEPMAAEPTAAKPTAAEPREGAGG
jgi:signal transduction histidine kinase/PAS domain-containing protein